MAAEMTTPRRADATYGQGEAAHVYDDGRLRVEHDNYHVSCGGRVVKLTRAEFLLLSRLALNADRTVESTELWRHAWGDAKHYNGESLHVHIYRLRLKLAPFGVEIETMIHVGYRLLSGSPSADESARESATRRPSTSTRNGT